MLKLCLDRHADGIFPGSMPGYDVTPTSTCRLFSHSVGDTQLSAEDASHVYDIYATAMVRNNAYSDHPWLGDMVWINMAYYIMRYMLGRYNKMPSKMTPKMINYDIYHDMVNDNPIGFHDMFSQQRRLGGWS